MGFAANMPLVFQYGSNCDAGRLRDRIDEFDDLGRALTIDEYEIAFDVYSNKNACAAADLVMAPHSDLHAWGVLYEMPDEGVARLQKIEGRKYEKRRIRVQNKVGEHVNAITFLVMDRHRQRNLWTGEEYVRHIVTGLRNHNVHRDYVQHVIDIAIRTNRGATEWQVAEQ
jgi:gamma-glutamylcyclotransferase (GGCT)/AIG2-like uncharacterized protein YtfP